MKTKILFGVLAFMLTLEARENPFVRYDMNTGKMLELSENISEVERIQEEKYIKNIQEQGSKRLEETKSIEKVNKTYTKKEVDTLIQKTKEQNEKKTKDIVKKEISKINKEPEQIIYVKPRKDIVDESPAIGNNSSKKILPFLDIQVQDNKLIIQSDYEMFKKFSLHKENKIAFDYKAKVNFTTKKEEINSVGVKSVTVGNHQKSAYFRVVLELVNNPSKYKVDVSGKTISISLK